MFRTSLFFALAVSLLAADNPWAKVQDLKSGSELRVYKKGASQPLAATFDEANEERIVIVVKDTQMAVAKDDIVRIDARPPTKKTPRKLNVDNTVKTTDPDFTPHPNPGVPAPGTSSNSSVNLGGGSKPDFETVYRKTASERPSEQKK